MEAAEKRNKFVAAAGVARQLDGGLRRLRAGIAEVNSLWSIAWRNGSQPLGQRHHVFVVEIRAGHMDQPGSLPLNGVDHARMAMAGSDDGDAGAEVQKAIS